MTFAPNFSLEYAGNASVAAVGIPNPPSRSVTLHAEKVWSASMDKSGPKIADSLTSSERRPDYREFLEAQARKRPVKVTAKLWNVSPKTVERLRAGERGLSGEKLFEVCLRDPEFAADWAQHVGVLNVGDAEFAGAFTRAVNAYVQRRGG